MKKGRSLYFGILILVIIVVLTVSFSYAFFIDRKEEHGKLNMVAGTLDYKLVGENIKENKVTISQNAIKEIKFTITSLNAIDSKYELYYIGNDGVEVGYMEPETNTKGEIKSNGNKEVTIYIRNNTSTDQTVELGVEGGFLKNELILTKGHLIPKVEYRIYQETILNGADPVLTDNLIPVIIDNDGTVSKADIYTKWYDYEEKNWANAVVLKDNSISYRNGEIIPEEAIESYFVWIPKYSYQLWDLGNYNSSTSIDNSKPHAIPIKFGLTNTSDSVTGECTTPGVLGESGSCKVGDYMTHPAFTAFDVNGIWVGKFETGYKGATTMEASQVNSNDSSKIIIKPNVYSWRNITVGNAFEASYSYLRNEESHMMKNTEWGMVAYLTHSNYGRCTNGVCTEVRINNNSSYITGYASTKDIRENGYRSEKTALGANGTYTKPYNSTIGYLGSTTGNITGIYDTVGGSPDYVMGYTTGASKVGGNSEITAIHSDFFTNSKWDKYYDRYTSIQNTDYNNRILGDATGEMGPFETNKLSWYQSEGSFMNSSNPFLIRGGVGFNENLRFETGIFSFESSNGHADGGYTFRVVLAPRL